MFINFYVKRELKKARPLLCYVSSVSGSEKKNAFQLGCVEKKKPRGWLHRDIQDGYWPRKPEVDIRLQLSGLIAHSSAERTLEALQVQSLFHFSRFHMIIFSFARPPVY